MPIPKELSLTPQELDELMLSSWNMRIATVGPGTRINLTPLWFGWANGNIYTYCRGQKVVNLRRQMDERGLLLLFDSESETWDLVERERAEPLLRD